MSDTALVIITDALLDIGVLADEEVPTASQAAGALRKLNNLLDGLKIQPNMNYGSFSYVKTLVPNQQIYTIGPGGDFDTDRPQIIQSAYIRSFAGAQSLDTPLKVYNDAEWADVALKQEAGTWPNYGIWFNYSYPLVQAYLNPIPLNSQYQLVIWIDGVLNNLSLDQVVLFPDGYKRYLTVALGKELCASYQVPFPQTSADILKEAQDTLKIQNFKPSLLDTGTYGQYDITSNRIYVR